MAQKILSALWVKEQAYPCAIFGHSGNSIPGLEIVGLGSQGRLIKEKIIFLCKQAHLKFPLKRFLLCLDGIDHHDLKNVQAEYLELPILILFLALTGHLPLGRIDRCFCSGKLGLEAQTYFPHFPQQFWDQIKKRSTTMGDLTLIGNFPNAPEEFPELCARELLRETLRTQNQFLEPIEIEQSNLLVRDSLQS